MQCLQYQIRLLLLSRSGLLSFGDRECSQVTTALFGRPIALEDRVESTDNIDSDIVHQLYRGEKWWFWRGLEGSPLSGAYLSISIDFKRYRLSLSFIVGHTVRYSYRPDVTFPMHSWIHTGEGRGSPCAGSMLRRGFILRF